MVARALVPVVIVGIIVAGVLLAMIITKIKRRDPAIKFQQAHVRLVREANDVFLNILDVSGNVETVSFLTEEHKQLVKNWMTYYRKVNG